VGDHVELQVGEPRAGFAQRRQVHQQVVGSHAGHVDHVQVEVALEGVLAAPHAGERQPGDGVVVAVEAPGQRVEVDRGPVRGTHPAHHGEPTDET
jgi:hypothetical protein